MIGEIISSVVYYCDLTLSLIADTHTHFSMMVDGGSLWILRSWTADGDETQSCRAAMCDV